MKYLGNCVNSFDLESGNSLIDIFQDVSDFACVLEDSIEVTKDLSILEFNKELLSIFQKDSTIMLYSEDREIYFLYDEENDIHYFFA